VIKRIWIAKSSPNQMDLFDLFLRNIENLSCKGIKGKS
jgi:hypothetical protein